MINEAVAVLDFGITNLKLLAVDRGGRVLASVRAATPVLREPHYLQLDTERVWNWLIDALGELARNRGLEIRAIVPCTHGSAAALVDERGLVLPVMHYEAQPPAEIAAAYTEIAPSFKEVFAPVNPGGMTLGRQLLWQQRLFPEAFARARRILCYPQYWAWRLCGEAASEVTSLGAQTHLWAPGRGDFSSLVESRGWRRLFAPLRHAWEPLGLLRPEISRQTGLAAATVVLCGIHDSNANYLRYLAGGREDFSLMSTGTWIINFNRVFPLEQLVAECDTNANVDVYGRPVACSRFMGGREYGLLAGDTAVPARPEAIARVVAGCVLALPSFSDSGGPFPGTGGRGRIVGRPPQDAAGRAGLATLYTALAALAALGHIGTGNEIVIDGTFAANELFCRLIAELHPHRAVFRAADQQDGTALGAALLRELADGRQTLAPALERVQPVAIAGLDAYAVRWQAAATGS